jgi:hypothetical protein
MNKSHNKTKTKQYHQDQLLDEKVAPIPFPIKGRITPKVEFHYNDTAQASYAGDTTGTVTALNLIAEGNDNINRLGKKAVMRSVAINGLAYLPGTTSTLSPGQARILLVWDNAADGAPPAITDVLVAISSTSYVNPNNIARFTILHDQRVTLGVLSYTSTSSVADKTCQPINVRKRIDAPTQYSGTAAAITSVQNGSLLMLTMGDGGAGSNRPVFQIATRVTFTDVL